MLKLEYTNYSSDQCLIILNILNILENLEYLSFLNSVPGLNRSEVKVDAVLWQWMYLYFMITKRFPPTPKWFSWSLGHLPFANDFSNLICNLPIRNPPKARVQQNSAASKESTTPLSPFLHITKQKLFSILPPCSHKSRTPSRNSNLRSTRGVHFQMSRNLIIVESSKGEAERTKPLAYYRMERTCLNHTHCINWEP